MTNSAGRSASYTPIILKKESVKKYAGMARMERKMVGRLHDRDARARQHYMFAATMAMTGSTTIHTA